MLLCLAIVSRLVWAVPARLEASVSEELDLVSGMTTALLDGAGDDDGLAIDD